VQKQKCDLKTVAGGGGEKKNRHHFSTGKKKRAQSAINEIERKGKKGEADIWQASLEGTVMRLRIIVRKKAIIELGPHAANTRGA